MIKIPRNHLADETLARVMVAARRQRAGRRELGAELEPDDDALVALPPELMPATRPPIAASPAPEPAPEETPPLEESGLDPGLVLQGADSFDALLKT